MKQGSKKQDSSLAFNQKRKFYSFDIDKFNKEITKDYDNPLDNIQQEELGEQSQNKEGELSDQNERTIKNDNYNQIQIDNTVSELHKPLIKRKSIRGESKLSKRVSKIGHPHQKLLSKNHGHWKPKMAI